MAFRQSLLFTICKRPKPHGSEKLKSNVKEFAFCFSVFGQKPADVLCQSSKMTTVSCVGRAVWEKLHINHRKLWAITQAKSVERTNAIVSVKKAAATECNKRRQKVGRRKCSAPGFAVRTERARDRGGGGTEGGREREAVLDPF